jgi:sodium/hydrogen antiporter
MDLSTTAFIAILALVGVVIIIAALMSGIIERTNFPQVAVFLALGAVIGVPGLGLLNISLDSPILRVVATLSLALVLFTDAVGLNFSEVRRHSSLALLVLGPGTMLSAVLITLAGWWMLGLPLAAAAIIGAALASTDPVLLRGLLRSRDLPAAARQALRLESGLNDVVLLPIVLIAMTFIMHGPEGANWTNLAVSMFLLGPGAGVLVGLLAVSTLDLVRRRVSVRRDYESIYSLGVAFAAFALAESVHGSGFLAAFAAGITISALDVELCDCFLEYGETTAEMALLFTFVLFGSSLIWTGLDVLTLTTLAFAVVVLLIRPFAFLLSLAFSKLPKKDKLLISWFGPRGLSTLLLVLLPVFEGVEGSEYWFAICSLVVLLSVLVHGGSMMMLGRWSGRIKGHTSAAGSQPVVTAVAASGSAPAAVSPAVSSPLPLLPGAVVRGKTHASDGAGNGREAHDGVETAAKDTGTANAGPVTEDHDSPNHVPVFSEEWWAEEEHGADRISIEEVRRLTDSGEQVIIVDARTERTYDNSDHKVVGEVRLDPGTGEIPERVTEMGLPKDAWLAIYCA